MINQKRPTSIHQPFKLISSHNVKSKTKDDVLLFQNFKPLHDRHSIHELNVNLIEPSITNKSSAFSKNRNTVKSKSSIHLSKKKIEVKKNHNNNDSDAINKKKSNKINSSILTANKKPTFIDDFVKKSFTTTSKKKISILTEPSLPNGEKPNFFNEKSLKNESKNSIKFSKYKEKHLTQENVYAGSSFHSSPAALNLPKPSFNTSTKLKFGSFFSIERSSPDGVNDFNKNHLFLNFKNPHTVYDNQNLFTDNDNKLISHLGTNNTNKSYYLKDTHDNNTKFFERTNTTKKNYNIDHQQFFTNTYSQVDGQNSFNTSQSTPFNIISHTNSQLVSIPVYICPQPNYNNKNFFYTQTANTNGQKITFNELLGLSKTS